jgi:hypothetical protein
VRTPHLGAPRGKRVRVALKDGTVFVARFKQRSDDHKMVEFEDHPPVRTRHVRSFAPYRSPTTKQGETP